MHPLGANKVHMRNFWKGTTQVTVSESVLQCKNDLLTNIL